MFSWYHSEFSNLIVKIEKCLLIVKQSFLEKAWISKSIQPLLKIKPPKAVDGGGLNDIWVTPRGLRGEEHCSQNSKYQRPVGAGGAWGFHGLPDFCRSVNPISTRGVRLCPKQYYCPLQFPDPPMALYQASEWQINQQRPLNMFFQ